MAAETKAVVEVASLVILGLLVGALSLMRSVATTARCRWCEHCRRADADEKARKARKRHESYHYLTDRAPSACQKDDCPGRH